MNNSKFRLNKPRLLVIGCGNVGMRLLPLVRERFRVFALTSDPGRRAELRAAGAIPVVANLDHKRSLRRLAGLARYVVHLAPPQPHGALDCRTRNVANILPEGGRVVYISTSGVYGDCGGAVVDETRPVAPTNARAQRRVDAERVLRAWAQRARGEVVILRAPGIYAGDRLPVKRLQEGVPALRDEDDVYTNHIHADDLARMAALALFRGLPGRVYHASDDTRMKMGEYFDAVADAFKLPRPRRLPRAELEQAVSPAALSFMSESRKLDNGRMKRELGMRLRYPDVASTLRRLTGTS